MKFEYPVGILEDFLKFQLKFIPVSIMFNVLISFISAIQSASKNLMDTLTEVYEPQWTGQDLLTVQGQNSEMLWADSAHKLSDRLKSPQSFDPGQ